VPPEFGLGLKVPETITVARWPGHARYGARAGELNEHFLDASLLDLALLRALEPHQGHVPVLMFEFGAFSKSDFANPRTSTSDWSVSSATCRRGGTTAWRSATRST
jgi:hypothetical protein